jgi:arginine utilization protein RocB
MNTATCASLITAACLTLAMTSAQAGETFSQTFYTGANSALAQARTQAIHYHHHANTAKQSHKKASVSGLTGLLAKALTPSKLERPVHLSGFRIQTLSSDTGFELNAAYRF